MNTHTWPQYPGLTELSEQDLSLSGGALLPTLFNLGWLKGVEEGMKAAQYVYNCVLELLDGIKTGWDLYEPYTTP